MTSTIFTTDIAENSLDTSEHILIYPLSIDLTIYYDNKINEVKNFDIIKIKSNDTIKIKAKILGGSGLYKYHWMVPQNSININNPLEFDLEKPLSGHYSLIVTDTKNRNQINIEFDIKLIDIPEIKIELLILPLANKFPEEICDESVEIVYPDEQLIVQSIDKNILKAIILENEIYEKYYEESTNHYICQWILPNEKIVNASEIEIMQNGKYTLNILRGDDILTSYSVKIIINKEPIIILNINNRNVICGNIVNVVKTNIHIDGTININYLSDEKINYELYLNDEMIDNGIFHLVNSKAIVDFGNYLITNFPSQLKLIIMSEEIIDICYITINKITEIVKKNFPLKNINEISQNNPSKKPKDNLNIIKSKDTNEINDKPKETVKHKVINSTHVCSGHTNKCKIMNKVAKRKI